VLAGRWYEETSRKGLGDFPLSECIKGYWDRTGIEIDLVVVSEFTMRIAYVLAFPNAIAYLRPSWTAFQIDRGRFLLEIRAMECMNPA